MGRDGTAAANRRLWLLAGSLLALLAACAPQADSGDSARQGQSGFYTHMNGGMSSSIGAGGR